MLEELKELIAKHKKSNDYYANKLGVSIEEIEELRAQIKKDKIPPEDLKPTTEIDYNWEQKVDNEKGTLQSTKETDFEPKNDEELASLHKVNLDKYKIATYYSKQKSNGKFTSTVFCSLKKPQDYTQEDFAKFLEKYEVPQLSFLYVGYKGAKNLPLVDVEYSIADFHLAKKTLQEESMKDKVEQYMNVLTDLINKTTASFSINKVVFPISNDFFHTDNYQNQTTAGTPQDVLMGYDSEYEVGFDLLVKAISTLQKIGNSVEVILVQGNHDRTKSFYVAHALEVFFKGNDKVSFKREHSTTKSTVLGPTFIGYHHGNCKIDDLPLIFATGKDSQAFGNATYREVHTGDKHHYMAKEVKGVRIQQMPSLSGTDRWHDDNNFVHSVRAAIATVYSDKGRIAEFESRI